MVSDNIIKLCFENGVGFGSDSCGAMKVIKAIENREDKEKLEQLITPCESTKESYFIDVDAMGYPCSFAQGTDKWKTGLDILNCNNFVNDIWNHHRNVEFRKTLNNCSKKYQNKT